MHYIHTYVLGILRQESEKTIPADSHLLNLHLLLFTSVVSPSKKKTYIVRLFVKTRTVGFLLCGTTLIFKIVLLKYTRKLNIYLWILNIWLLLTGILLEGLETSCWTDIHWYTLIYHLATARLVCKVTSLSSFILCKQLQVEQLYPWKTIRFLKARIQSTVGRFNETGICSTWTLY